MNKDKIKFVLIIVVAFIAGALLMNFLAQEEAPAEVDDDITAQIQAIFQEMPENDERLKVVGRTEDEVIQEFNQGKERCLLRNQDPDLVLENETQASRYFTCEALKSQEVDDCDLLTNPANRRRCERTVVNYAQSLFPALEAGGCTEEAINVCQDADDPELSAEECQPFCEGLVEKNSQGCDQIEGDLQRVMCFTVAEGSIEACEDLSGESRVNCEDQYYLFEAIENEDPSYLDNIEIPFNYMVGSVYLDAEETCGDILEDATREYCEKEYSEDRLETRLELRREVEELERELDIDVEDYINQQ